MSKVKFGENDSRIVELQQTATLEKQQADDATRKHTRIQRRIRAFYEAIEYVSFRSADDAPIWASNWLDWLLDGVFAMPDVVDQDQNGEPDSADKESVAAEAGLEDQPDLDAAPELDDEPNDEPPAPTAAAA